MDTSGSVTHFDLAARDQVTGKDWQGEITLYEGATHWEFKGVARSPETAEVRVVHGSVDPSTNPLFVEAGPVAWLRIEIAYKLPMFSGVDIRTADFAEEALEFGPSNRVAATGPGQSTRPGGLHAAELTNPRGEAPVTLAHRASLAAPASVTPELPAIDADFELDAAQIAGAAAKSALFGVVAVGVGLAAGPVVGAGILTGLFLNSFLMRVGDAVAAGSRDGALGRAATAGASDLLPGSVVELMEAGFGVDYMTGRVLSNAERNERIGGIAGGVRGGRARGTGAVTGSAAHIRLRDAGGPAVRTVRKRTRRDERDLQYNRGEGEWQIYGYRTLRNALAGKDTGMDANHLIPGEWFAKGPSHLRALYDFVPSVTLAGGAEHQGTFHGRGINPELSDWGLYKQPVYTQADVERGMNELAAYYSANGHSEFAQAVREFRREIFDKVKR